MSLRDSTDGERQHDEWRTEAAAGAAADGAAHGAGHCIMDTTITGTML
jgi:hypothetical protein